MMDEIIDFLRSYLVDKPAVIGLSGGVDSAVVATLLARAISPDRIYSYHLPSSTNAFEDLIDAKHLAENLGIHFETVPLEGILSAYLTLGPTLTPLALGNLKARVRMSILYTRANLLGGLVIGTGNKTELQLGYFTKYGDGGVDLLPIAHLYKTQVWQLAKELALPAQFVTKAPSAGLWAGQTDEAELGVTYALADQILQAQENQQSLSNFEQSTVQRIQQLQQAGAHKLALPPHL